VLFTVILFVIVVVVIVISVFAAENKQIGPLRLKETSYSLSSSWALRAKLGIVLRKQTDGSAVRQGG